MFSIIILQAAGGFDFKFLAMMGLMIVVFYVFMIRPQQKKQKDQKKFIDELKKGDYVVTIGGAHGYVAETEGETFILEVEKGGRIKFNKSAISLDMTKAAQAKK